MCKCEDSSLRRFVQCKLNCSLVISRWSFKWLNLFWLQKSSLVATCDSLKKKRTFLGEEWNGPEPVTDPKVIPWKSASRWFDQKSVQPVQQTSKKFATELAEKINSSPKSLIKLFRFQKGCDFETAIRHQEEEVHICISLSPSPAALSWRQPPGSIASDVLVCSPVYKCSSVLVVPLVYKCTSVLHSRRWTVAVKQSYTGYFLDWHLRAPE